MISFHKVAGLTTLTLGMGLVTTLSAGSVFSGSYSYIYTGSTGQIAACSGTGSGSAAGTADIFSGSGSDTTLNNPLTLTFSACNDTVPLLIGVSFTVSDTSGDSATGVFSGIDTADTATIDGNIYNIGEGGYTITSATGDYEDIPTTGEFTVETGAVGGPVQGDGFLDLTSAPEPTTFALMGAGMLFAGIVRRRRQIKQS